MAAPACVLYGMKKTESNYDTAAVAARALFLEHDQDRMIENFALPHDEQYLYLRFVGYLYRIDRKTGRVDKEISGDWNREKTGFDEVMSIYDMLCNENGRPVLSGVWQSVKEMNRVKSGGKTLESGLNTRQEAFFSGKQEALAAACRALGGTPAPVGDVAFYLSIFDCLPVYFQFWEGDEEFPAQIRVLWDKNTMNHLHFETTFYITGHLLGLLEEIIRGQRPELGQEKGAAL